MDDGKANAFGFDMMSALSDALKKSESDAGVVLLTGRPGIFSAGFDLKVMNKGQQAMADMIGQGANLLMDLFLHPQPIVMVCSGHSLAAGALILLTGDYRVGIDGEFKIGLNETAIGMTMPHFGIELARDRLGSKTLTQAVLNAQLYNPKEAVDIGYLDQSVDKNQLEFTVQEKLKSLLSLDGKAFAASKKGIRNTTAELIRNNLQGK
jgi:enoyl-CoA hydratase